MTQKEFETLINTPDYDFLRTNDRLGKNIMFLTLGGSHAYGTNVEGSDVDVRGVALNSRSDLLGMSTFEQVIDNNTDTTIYSFRKIISLLSNCNPNTIEILGGTPDQYLALSAAGKMLLDNKDLFLSKRAARSFGGYANAQLRRLQTAVARDRVTPAVKGQFVVDTINHSMLTLEEHHNIPHGTISVRVSDKLDDYGNAIIAIGPGANVDELLKSDVSVGDFDGFLGEVNGIIKSYGRISGRNARAKEKSDAQLNKHAMHLVRLYLMAFDILENHKIVTFREKDREELLAIRAGKYMTPDGTYIPEFFELIDGYEERLKRDTEESTLPDAPDMKKIEELAMSINAYSLGIS